jgi:hypothetical protein
MIWGSVFRYGNIVKTSYFIFTMTLMTSLLFDYLENVCRSVVELHDIKVWHCRFAIGTPFTFRIFTELNC